MSSPAYQVSGSGVARAVPDQHVLGRLAASFVERLPLGLQQVRALLASDGCPVDCHELADLVRYYRLRGATVPFRIVRFGGMEIAVAPSEARAAAQVGAAAVRMVQHWGIVNLEALADRTEIVSTSIIPRTFVRKIVAAAPATRWLGGAGPGKDWFSFDGRQSDLVAAIDKVMALGRSVSVADLRVALTRASTTVEDAPPAVFERYLVDIAGCAIDGDRVSRRGRFSRQLLTGPETTLVEVLRAAGGGLAPSALRRRAAEQALSDATLTRLLRFSPLVVRTKENEIRLVGNDGAPAAQPMRGPEAATAKAAPDRVEQPGRVQMAS